VADVFANLLLLQSMLISDDFPTLLLPIKAYSGKLLFLQSLNCPALLTNIALEIFN
jgi:hypothetical protein